MKTTKHRLSFQGIINDIQELPISGNFKSDDIIVHNVLSKIYIFDTDTNGWLEFTDTHSKHVKLHNNYIQYATLLYNIKSKMYSNMNISKHRYLIPNPRIFNIEHSKVITSTYIMDIIENAKNMQELITTLSVLEIK